MPFYVINLCSESEIFQRALPGTSHGPRTKRKVDSGSILHGESGGMGDTGGFLAFEYPNGHAESVRNVLSECVRNGYCQIFPLKYQWGGICPKLFGGKCPKFAGKCPKFVYI